MIRDEVAKPDEQHTAIVGQLTQLGMDVEALRSSGTWQQMLATAARFTHYSMHNRLFIWCQRPDATRCAGYRKWQSFGRQVRKGEQGIKIFAPMTYSRLNEVGEKETVIRGYKVVSVFDIAQTDGDPLPEIEWPQVVDGPEQLFGHLVLQAKAVADLDVFEPYEDVGPVGARGWYIRADRQVAVRGWDDPRQAAATLLHELAHHYDPMLVESPTLYARHRADCELVAESAAWLVGSAQGLGMDAEVTHYLASWQGSLEDLVRLTSRIGKTQAALVRLVVPEVEVTEAVA